MATHQPFTLYAWRAYINSMVLPRLDPEGVRRAELLLDDFQLNATWERLAGDVRPFGYPPSVDQFEALHAVVGCVAFPPSIINPPTKEQSDAVATALRRLKLAYAKYPHIGGHITSIVNSDPSLGVRLPSSAQGVGAVIEAIENASFKSIARPLMPSSQGKNGDRNWLALYLRDRIMPVFFFHAHHDEIARLLKTAYPEWEPFSDGLVEQLKAW